MVDSKFQTEAALEYRIQIFELLELEVSNDNVIHHAVTASTVSFKSLLYV